MTYHEAEQLIAAVEQRTPQRHEVIAEIIDEAHRKSGAGGAVGWLATTVYELRMDLLSKTKEPAHGSHGVHF